MNAFQFYSKVYLARIRSMSFKELLISLIILAFLPSMANQLLLLAVNDIQLHTVVMIALIIGFLLGLGICLALDSMEEYRFLWYVTQEKNFLTDYSFLKKAFPLMIWLWFILGSIIWGTSFSVTDILQIALQSTVGYLVANLVLTAWIVNIWRQLASYFCTIVIGCLIWDIPSPIFRILALTCNCFFLVFLTRWVAQYAWTKKLKFKHRSYQTVWKMHFLSDAPMLKKDLTFLFTTERIIPLLLVFLLCQVAFYFLCNIYSKTIFIGSLIWISFLHEAWTLNLVGMEGRTIGLYKALPSPWKRLILTKWLLPLGLIECWGVFPYPIWTIYQNQSFKDVVLTFTTLTVYNVILSIFSLQVGTYFAEFSKSGYYRIRYLGILVNAFGIIILIMLFFRAEFIVLPLGLAFAYSIVRFIKNEHVKRYVP